MSDESVSIAITGAGGAGVLTAGQMLLDAAAKAGLYGLMTRSSGPQIRGGEVAAFVRMAARPVEGPGDRCDILLALDWLNVERFASEIMLDADSIIVCDEGAGPVPARFVETNARVAALALKERAKSLPGVRLNMLGLGILAALTDLPASAIGAVVEKALKGKGGEALDAGLVGFEAGVKMADGIGGQLFCLTSARTNGGERWNISGNEAAGLGAVRGGVRFVAAYPITPATEMLEWLAPNLERIGGVLVQAEDELASINMIVGASFGGRPALTATSGPGLALMTESIGLAVASETPIVIVDVMRGGPSTGIPTKSEQSDLNIALHGLHGDAPHIVTGATSIADCLFTTQWSVHLAERLQAPVIVLTDQALGQSRAIIDRPADLAFASGREVAAAGAADYRRYAVTTSGVSPMAIPGTPGVAYVADGLEHAPSGRPSSGAEDHLAQLDKRARKLEAFDYGNHWADIVGDGELAVVTWGSCTGPVREACERAAAAGVATRLIALRLLAPAQEERFAAAMAGIERVLVVEQSHSRQFYRYLRGHYDLPRLRRVFARPGPLPIRPAEIVDQILSWK